jgi:hypothetical protein
MTRAEILEEIKKLTPAERLTIIEAALQLVRADLQQVERPATQTERQRQMAVAAEALLADYTTDSELTSFTTLDSEDIHA